MEEPVALVVGATGAAATRLCQHLANDRGFTVHGVCRRPPPDGAPFRHVAADLMDRDGTARAFAPLGEVTHVFYAARAPFAEGGVEDVEGNVAMLRNVIDGIEAASKRLEHVHLVEGGKWYGVHIGPYRTPAKEDDPRHLPPNFYYDQEDLVAERARAGGWSWTASRPNVICDFAPERARNLVPVIGAYAAICRETGTPLDFPGTEAAFRSLTEVTDARLYARALAFLATEEGCRNRAFNVTNGDIFRWETVWPAFAAFFGVPPGRPRPFRLADWMADKGPLWRRIAKDHGLAQADLSAVAAWGFGDFVFGQEHDVISDLGRLRRAGFCDHTDSEEMFIDHFRSYREARILP